MIVEGMWVKVKIKEDDACYNMLKKYNGKLMKVIKAKKIKSEYYYELDGAVSPKGLPYSFSEDMLIAQDLFG